MATPIEIMGYALKTRYTQKFVNDLTGADAPLWARLNKEEDFDGEGEKIPLIYGRPQGLAGQSLAIAQGNKSRTRGAHFFITAGDYFGTVDISDKAMMASRSNMGAFLKHKTIEIDGLHLQARDDLCQYLTGTATGWFGIVESTSAPGGGQPDNIVVTESWMLRNVEQDMQFVSSANDGSDPSHVLNAGGALTVVNVIRETRTIQVAAGGVASITGLGTGDYLFREGNFVGNTGTFVMHGIQDYVYPSSTPPVLNQMTRTPDPTRLAGIRLPAADISGLSIEERIMLLGTRARSLYKAPGFTDFYLNDEDWLQLSVSLMSKGIRPLEDDSTSFGFNYLEVATGGKKVKVFADPFIPQGLGLGMKMDTWTLKSMGPILHALDGDGIPLLRAGTTNDYEYRLVSYPELVTNAPGWNGRVSLIG